MCCCLFLECQAFPDLAPDLSVSNFETVHSEMDLQPSTPQDQASLGAQQPSATATSAQGTPRVRARIRKVLTPRSLKRLQRYRDENNRIRQVVARLKKPTRPIASRAQLLCTGARFNVA
ncbi:uncharacterized protein [Dermacentor andersoni]|uniref:uncharacterized protein n=1 Tax=Dermacentor andersoni TaxID=34620 RepID=UPI003B3AEC7E